MKELITNLTKGELGPELQARIDIPQYRAGARQLRNFIIQRYGGAALRPGFRLVAPADDVDTPMRYVPFDYGLGTSYVLAFQDLAFRPLALGGAVLEENLEILAVTDEAQAVLTVSFHEWEVGDRIFLSGVTGMTELNGQFVEVVEVVDADNVRVNLDTRDYTAFIDSDGTNRVGPPPAPPAPPAPPPAPPDPPEPPDVGGGGGTGGGWGGFMNEGQIP